MHAELVDVRTVRWVLPAAALPGRGEVVSAPDAVAPLLRQGMRLRVEPDGILVTLPPGESWRRWTEPVRHALVAALAEPGWETSGGESLEEALGTVIAGEAGEFIRSHGGRVEVVRVDGDDATLRFSGTCAFCPALGLTLTARVESAVRERYPHLGELHVERGPRRRFL